MAAGREPTLTVAPEAVLERVERQLEVFLSRRREEMATVDPAAGLLVDEIGRIVRAGGKRIRPAFCYWGYRCAGGEDDEPIVRAAAALELFHTFALVHDDVMDAARTRRGVPSSHIHLAGEARRLGLPDPERFGVSAAILAGDLANVLADELLLESGFPPKALAPALHSYHRMRAEMAAGQLLDLEGAGLDPARARRVASLKTGGYTVEGPLRLGAILAGASTEVLACLSRYGVPLGEAFQLRDDVLDAEEDGRPGAGPDPADVNELVERARATLDPTVLASRGVAALSALADLVRLP